MVQEFIRKWISPSSTPDILPAFDEEGELMNKIALVLSDTSNKKNTLFKSDVSRQR